jgi:hypothetical protein
MRAIVAFERRTSPTPENTEAYDWITANMASNSLYQFAIARGQALVLPEAF